MSHKISLWDVEKRTELWGSAVNSPLCAAFSADGKRAAVGLRDGLILLWDVAGGQATDKLNQHSQGVRCLTFLPGEQRLLSVGSQSQLGTEIFLWDLKKRGVVQGLAGAEVTIPICLHVDQHGDVITTVAAREQTLEVVVEQFSTRNNARLKSGTLPLATAAAITPDGKTLVLAEKGVPAQVYSLPGLKHKKELGKFDRTILAMAISPDSKTLVVGNSGGALEGWSLDNGKRLWAAKLPTPGTINALAISRDQKLVAVGGGSNFEDPGNIHRILYLFSLDKGELVGTLAGK
jgi:WD40 repeat protein